MPPMVVKQSYSDRATWKTTIRSSSLRGVLSTQLEVGTFFATIPNEGAAHLPGSGLRMGYEKGRVGAPYINLLHG